MARRDLVNQLHEMLHIAEAPEMIQLLSNMTHVLKTNAEAETRDLDPDWFKGGTPLFLCYIYVQLYLDY